MADKQQPCGQQRSVQNRERFSDFQRLEQERVCFEMCALVLERPKTRCSKSGKRILSPRSPANQKIEVASARQAYEKKLNLRRGTFEPDLSAVMLGAAF